MEVARNDGDFYTSPEEVATQYEMSQAEAEAMNKQMEELKGGQSTRAVSSDERLQVDVAKIVSESASLIKTLDASKVTASEDPYFSNNEIDEMLKLYKSEEGQKLLESSSKATRDLVNKFMVQQQSKVQSNKTQEK